MRRSVENLVNRRFPEEAWNQWRGLLLKVGLLILLFLILLSQSFVVVAPGERAVIFSRLHGVLSFQLEEGIHFTWPFLWRPTIYDVKTATYTMSGTPHEGDVMGDDSLTALTSDGLMVWLDLSVRFHPDPELVWKLHREIGPHYIEKIVRPQARSKTRMVVAKYTVTDVYSGKRQQIVEELNQQLEESFARSHIILDEVLLRNVRFSPAFQAAIERKQVALQEAKKMDFVLEQARKEKERRIIEAQGEAEAIRLKAEALRRNPQLVQYEYVKGLPSAPQTVITDGKTILSLGELFGTGGGK
ncbi:MAG TPA: prohibitin family protein [Armatimonadetes bacterium]|nr:prohibitin family protein [Armatimonadota bacterium]